MADDRIDWASVMAVGLVADAWFDERPDRRVRSLLEHELHGRLDPYQDNVTAIASALREAFEAGQREDVVYWRERAAAADEIADALRDELRALRRELAALRVLLGYLRGKEDTGLFVDDYGRVGVFFTGNISCAPDDWYTSHTALAAALGLEVEDDG